MVSNRAFACVGAGDDQGVKLCVFVFRIKLDDIKWELEVVGADLEVVGVSSLNLCVIPKGFRFIVH
ncbi:MAG: hypothetical protein LWW98_03150 [Deltaproteobacteria bacterium]|nr:hypothetical protein [Deltaproteobacteria bacterium]